MFTAILIAALLIAAIPAGLALAKWIDGDAGVVIARTRQLMGQGMTRAQAEDQAERELFSSR